MRSIITALFAALLVAQQPASENVPPPPPIQKTSIQGTVTKFGTGQPAKNARVSLQRVDAPARSGAANPLGALFAGGQNILGNLLSGLAGAAAPNAAADIKGQFVLADVTPGQYRIVVEGEGFVRQEYGQRAIGGPGAVVTIAGGQQIAMDFQVAMASTISGRVRDQYGEAVNQATVHAYAYQYNNGSRSLTQMATTQTNDLGEYRLFWLQPGEYFVGVSGTAGAGPGTQGGPPILALLGGNNSALGSLVQQFTRAGGPPPTYFPGVIDSDQAAPIKVNASSDVRSIDFNLRAVATVSVKGHVVAPFSLAPAGPRGTAGGGFAGAGANADLIASLLGGGGQGAQVSLTRVGAAQSGLAGLGLGITPGGTPVAADGAFEIRTVAPGAYTLSAIARDQAGQQYTARTRVEVGSGELNNLVLTVRAGVEVKGQIVLDSTQKPFDLTKLRVSTVAADDPTGGLVSQIQEAVAASPAQGRGGAGGAAAGGRGGRGQVLPGALGNQPQPGGTVAADGTFTLTNVSAFENRIRITGLPAGTYLKAGRLGNSDILNAPFIVDDPAVAIQLQLGGSPGRVSGTVVDAKGSPYGGVLTALVPDEARRGRNDLYFTVTSDQNGKISFANVPPGNYKLFSWEDIPSGAYQYPGFVRSYEDRGQAITVAADGAVDAALTVIPSTKS